MVIVRNLVLAVLSILQSAWTLEAHAENRLPAYLGAAERIVQSEPRPWTIADAVEVRRVLGTALSDRSRDVAFVVKQSFIDSDEIRYGLYVAAPHANTARKIIESAYIDELSAHPNSALWTVRADFGAGIQLYDVDDSGVQHPLVVNERPVLTGPAEGMVAQEANDAPRQTGIASYEWAPDGTALWYSKYRLRDIADSKSLSQHGIVLDDQDMDFHSFLKDSTRVLGVELHLFRPTDSTDRQLMFVPGRYESGILFRRQDNTAYWERDSKHIFCALWRWKPDTSLDMSAWSVDSRTGEARDVTRTALTEFLTGIRAADGRGYLIVRLMPDGHHLLHIKEDGKIAKDHGKVGFKRLDSFANTGSWSNQASTRQVLAVAYEDRTGLVTLPESRAGRALEKVQDTLSACSFTGSLRRGVCVRENVISPPELVDVDMKDGTVKRLIDLNSRYENVRKLDVSATTWINRYGNRNYGYVTRSAAYENGAKLPTVVVTHARDATNRFADDDFQWELPVQVLAEEGFLVMSVNEPVQTPQSIEAMETRAGIQSNQGTSEIQFNEAFNAVASMEAALTWAIDQGHADPKKTGIAGYSRGAELVEWVMTQSTSFHAAIEGDAGGAPAGHYGFVWKPERARMRQLYGGSPFDPGASPDYQRLSPSFRSKAFSGPLLQLFSQDHAIGALELHYLLGDASIPTELVYFPHENHLFWGPRHRAAAMQRSVDWFNYWLLGKRDSAAVSEHDYARWDAMAAEWKKAQM